MPETTTEFVKFRIFSMPCCSFQLCWVNPRLPIYCPECGEAVLQYLKNPEYTILKDDTARLILFPKIGDRP